jgi:hypothetical protein
MTNCKVDTVHGSQSGDHADIMQCWAMSANRTFIVDRMDGITQYQGFMLQPQQFGVDDGVVFDIRNSILRKSSTDNGGYLIYESNASGYEVKCSNVQFQQGASKTTALYYPLSARPAGIRVVTSANDEPVLIGSPGVGYVRPS